MDDADRRQDLAGFLRTRRERLSPVDVGLAAGGRRRTPGLRREEVALLAHVGTSWYTALEQGRDVHPSEQVLESLAKALRLTAVERQHLFLLARQHVPPAAATPAEVVSPTVHHVIHALNPHPAYVIGRRWDVLIWNRAAQLVFGFSDTVPPRERNLMWRYVHHPAFHRRGRDWEPALQAVVARFRADSARHPGDAGFAELIAELQQTSSQFRLWWSQHDVRSVPDGLKSIRHPALGRLAFTHTALLVPTNPDLRVMMYAASPATAAKLARALSAARRPHHHSDADQADD